MTGHRCSGKIFRLAMVLGMTSSFFVVEMVVAYWTNSASLMADSFNMLSDIIAMAMGLTAIIKASQPWPRSTYGWARAEVLGALANAVFLMAICFSITIDAIQRFITPSLIVQPVLVFGTGCAGLLINLIGCAVLFSYGHGEGNSTVTEDGGRMNMHSVYLHVFADGLGSLVVVVSALVIWQTDWDYKMYVDPVLSLFIACVVSVSTWPLLRDSSLVVLQTIPRNIEVEDIKKELTIIPEVDDIHEFHIWQLDGERSIVSAHIRIKSPENYTAILDRIKEILHTKGIHSSTIQLELIETNGSYSPGDCRHDCVGKEGDCVTCCQRRQMQITNGATNTSFC